MYVIQFNTVKPVYNDHLNGYFSAFWSSSWWPKATKMSSRRQELLVRVNWYIQSSLKHITELITGNKSYDRGGHYRQVTLYHKDNGNVLYGYLLLLISYDRSFPASRMNADADNISYLIIMNGWLQSAPFGSLLSCETVLNTHRTIAVASNNKLSLLSNSRLH